MRVCRIGQKSGLISVNTHKMDISSGSIWQSEQKVRNYTEKSVLTFGQRTLKVATQVVKNLNSAVGDRFE